MRISAPSNKIVKSVDKPNRRARFRTNCTPNDVVNLVYFVATAKDPPHILDHSIRGQTIVFNQKEFKITFH